MNYKLGKGLNPDEFKYGKVHFWIEKISKKRYEVYLAGTGLIAFIMKFSDSGKLLMGEYYPERTGNQVMEAETKLRELYQEKGHYYK